MKKRKGKCLSIEDESGPADAKRNCTLKRRRLKTTTTHQMSWHEPFVSRRSHTHTHTKTHFGHLAPCPSQGPFPHLPIPLQHTRSSFQTDTKDGNNHNRFRCTSPQIFPRFFLPYEKGKHNTVHSFVMARHGDERGVRAPTHTRSNEYK